MKEDMIFKVLWIDDQPNEAFMNEAYEYGLKLTNYTCVNDGIKHLKNKKESWDAIILDANCKITSDENEVPSLDALTEAQYSLIEIRSLLPWFVYTGGDYEGVEALRNIIRKHGRDYDDRQYYEKPKQRYELFENIKKAIINNDVIKIKHEYYDVCSFYKENDLIELLIENKTDKIITDVEVPNKIRKILEWIMGYLNETGILPLKFTVSNINDCSRILGDKRMLSFVPIYIQRSLHSCVEISNNGSHRDVIDEDIKSGNALYLNKCLLMELVNVLSWCASIDKEIKKIGESKIKEFQSKTLDILKAIKSVKTIGKIEEDEKGFIHVGEYYICQCYDKSKLGMEKGDVIGITNESKSNDVKESMFNYSKKLTEKDFIKLAFM
jgi:hypothetical protein